jgi:hypothetical protein
MGLIFCNLAHCESKNTFSQSSTMWHIVHLANKY